ncbi:MAG: hypothetical protein IJ091_00800 [Oscillospiraceae bacterium]|nr:hypothetical protein [Oscillospiraceae bacterium]
MDSYPTYDKNCEELTPDDLTVTLAKWTRTVPVVMRKGYDFTRWYEDRECTKKAEPDPYSDNTYYAGWEPWSKEKEAKLLDYDEKMRHVKYLMARPEAFTWESFVPFYRAANELVFQYEGNNLLPDEKAWEIFESLPSLEEKLVQVKDPEDSIWYIWGDQMAEAPDADTYDYFFKFDYKGFKPFLIPYMMEDQSKVKGNIIVVAGGGFSQRWNQTEGYVMAKDFRDLGYNAFVLQRRVQPSKTEDAYLDLQRAVRYLKYNAEKYGIAHIDRIATTGFSGGGMTIVGQLERFYGHELPSKFYPDYVPDEVDLVDADYAVAMPIYGGYAPSTDENPNFPAFFVASGAKDALMRPLKAERPFFEFLDRHPEIDCELLIFAGAPHGFGTGKGAGPEHHLGDPGYLGVDEWMRLADIFMMVQFGIIPRTYKRGERPI